MWSGVEEGKAAVSPIAVQFVSRQGFIFIIYARTCVQVELYWYSRFRNSNRGFQVSWFISAAANLNLVEESTGERANQR